MSESLGKKAEGKIKEWLNRPEDGYSFDRLYDQLSGYYLTSRNICDFICYKYPYIYYIESKETEADRFDFDMIQPHQHDGLLEKSKIKGCYGLVIVLFTTYKRAFVLKIQDIVELENQGKKSLNIKKIDKWTVPYKEIQTIPSRKAMLDYTGELEDLV
ncbi:MAG: Holliday junction resolvase RecU [Bacteroidaceae bacterium]|nr:Holliday junction resolvase RecU [Bacteroidaceae bacterium]